MIQILCEKVKQLFNRNGSIEIVYFMMIPMVLGICLCAVCLFATTWSWYKATQITYDQTIQTANYIVNATIENIHGDVVSEYDGEYLLQANVEYTITLDAVGNASTGYCIVLISDSRKQTAEYQTIQFPNKDNPDCTTICFTVTPLDNVTMKIIPQWGSFSNFEKERWENGGNY